jgi:hypothetical protein
VDDNAKHSNDMSNNVQVIKLEVDGNVVDLPHIEGIIILNIMRLDTTLVHA